MHAALTLFADQKRTSALRACAAPTTLFPSTQRPCRPLELSCVNRKGAARSGCGVAAAHGQSSTGNAERAHSGAQRRGVAAGG